MAASERTQCAWWKTNTMVLLCMGFLASGWMRPTQLKEHPAVYLRIHFMIWKELDSTKIWICSSTNPLSWSALCGGLSHCQRNSAHAKGWGVDGFNQKGDGSNACAPWRCLPQHALRFLWYLKLLWKKWRLAPPLPLALLLTDAGCHSLCAPEQHQKFLCEPHLETSKADKLFRMSTSFLSWWSFGCRKDAWTCYT